MVAGDFGYRPTPEKPLLVGLLIDVSGSMKSSIQNRSGRSLSRLESFRDALNDLVEKAKEMSRVGSSEKIAPLIKIFAYGFGFGNPIAFVFGGTGPEVRDLLAIPGKSATTVSIDKLANEWTKYRRHVEDMAIEMFGNTPMGKGFRIVRDRFVQELAQNRVTGQPVLFVLSDGEPTDASPGEIIEIAQQIKESGIVIVSCYVTDEDVAEPRIIYSSSPDYWPSGAKLMFECASVLQSDSSFYSYLREYNWKVEANGRFFTQINQSEILSEFMNAILSPLDQPENTNKKENPMIETVAIPILLKAVDFLFGEGSKILEERRIRRKEDIDVSKEVSVLKTTAKTEVIQSREEALRTKIVESVWSASEARIKHLMNLLEIQTKNYYLAREKYARFGRDHVPNYVVHEIEEAEDEIAKTTKELRKALSNVYGKEVSASKVEQA